MNLKITDLLNKIIKRIEIKNIQEIDAEFFYADDEIGRAFLAGAMAAHLDDIITLRMIIDDPEALD